jgi:hypothetical protein
MSRTIRRRKERKFKKKDKQVILYRKPPRISREGFAHLARYLYDEK